MGAPHAQRAIVTGANTGLGYRTALELARAGVGVILAVRSPERGADAAERIIADVPTADLRVARLDLGDLVSVRSFVADELDAGPLDLLVANAGVMLVPRREFTTDGFEMHMGVNHLGHYALTVGLLPALLAVPAPRVVVVSSLAHWRATKLDPSLSVAGKYSPMGAYGQSKLANLLFVAELHRRYRSHGLRAVAAHPGWSATELLERDDDPGFTTKLSRQATQILGSSPEAGARPQIFAALDPSINGGEFIGPSFAVRGRPRPGPRSRAARDEGNARWLWDISAEQTA